MSQYYHIINQEETRILYKNLESVFSRVFLLELHNKKLRKQIAKRHSVIKNRTQRNLQNHLNDLSMKLDSENAQGEILLTTTEDLLGGSSSKVEFENSYLLTEMNETVSSRPQSPSNAALNTSIMNTTENLRLSHRRRTAYKNEALRHNEIKIRNEEDDQNTDFVEYLEFIVECFKQLERLDAAGRKLINVFQDHKDFRLLSLRNWIINLDIWGSYLPLNAQFYDIQLTRTAAYTKIHDFRKQIKIILQQRRDFGLITGTNTSQGNLMVNLTNQIEVIDYYFSKIEEYMSRKHRNSLLKAGGNGTELGSDSASNLSGSPRSSINSERMNTQTVDDLFDKAAQEGNIGEIEMEDLAETKQSQSKRFEFPDESEQEEKVEKRKID